ncbi:unnamed protein product [Ectocarpus sp. CCAP 1310/34]|nr:unnamed protein product [Ectocarpus sp. CCAP 1310/34]
MVWYCADKRCPPKTRACYGHRDTTGKPRGDKMCFAHKTPTMISLNATHCKYAGCRRSPSYGCVSEPTKGLRIFCSEHGKGKKGMSNVKDKRCAEPECKTLANYGFGKSTYCGLHKKNGMSKRAAPAAASVMRGPVVSSQESAATVVDTSPASVTVRAEDSVGESGQRPASAATGSVQDSVVTAAGGECERGGGRKPPEPRNKSVAVAVIAFAAAAHTSDRDSLVNTAARDKGEGEGGGQPSESLVNTAAATAGVQGEGEGAAAAAAGEVERGEREDTSPAPAASTAVGEGEGDKREEVRKAVAHVVEVTVQELASALVEGEGQGEAAAAAGVQGEGGGEAVSAGSVHCEGEGAVAEAAPIEGVQGEGEGAAAEAEAAAGVRGEGEGVAAEAEAAAGEVGREERALVIDTFAAPATVAPTSPAPPPPPPPLAPQGVEGSSGTGAAANGGGRGGGSGSGGVHEDEEYAVPVAEADSDDDGAAVVPPGQGTDPAQPVPASGERGRVEIGARGEECTAPATGGWFISRSGGGGGSGGGESGTAKDAATSVSAAGPAAGAGGLEMASSSNLQLLATVCVRAENESYGGIESGGGGDGANHDETVPIEDGAPDFSQELAVTQVTGTQPDEAVAAASASAQAVVETATPVQDTEREQPLPPREALVAGGVEVQVVGEAGAGDVMRTSSGSVGVAQQTGEAPRVQESRGSHDLLDQIRVYGGEVEQGEAISDALAVAPDSSSGGGGGGSGSGSENGSENGGGDEHEEDDISVPRRSSRVVGSSALESPSVVHLLAQIRTDDPRVEVLKLHNYIPADVSTPVIDAVLEALMLNNCQALYIQNVSNGLRDEQLMMLAKVLRKGNIWCLNAGENSKIKPSTWCDFVKEIDKTGVTHAYLSEECIPIGLKKAMRTAIRANRVKHTRHKSASNVKVIRRCTNMWWNPILCKELQAELKAAAAAAKGRSGGGSSSSSSSSSSSDGGSEGDESGTLSGSGAARAAALQATTEKPSGGGSAGGSSTAPKGKGKRKAGQQEQTDVRSGRNKRRRTGGAGRNATKASATERDSKRASGTGRAEKMSDDPKSRQEVWNAGFDDDEAAMDFEDACYESDVEARHELAQEEKKEREAWESEREAEREKEKQKQMSKTFHRIKTPSEQESERFQKAPVQVFPGDTIPVDCIRSWGAEFGFHDKIRCGYCNAGTELKTSDEQKTERTDLELLIRKKRAERGEDGDGEK